MEITLILNTDNGTIRVSNDENVEGIQALVLGQEKDPAKLLQIVKTKQMCDMLLQLSWVFEKEAMSSFGKINFGIPIPPQMINFLLIEIAELDIPVRLCNCLKAAGICKVYEIFTILDDIEEMKLRNFGNISRKDLRQMLDDAGFTKDILPIFQAKILPKWQYITAFPVSEVVEITEDPSFKRLCDISSSIFDFSTHALGSFLNKFPFIAIFSNSFHDTYKLNVYEQQVTIVERKEIRELLEKIKISVRKFCDKEIINSVS